MQPASPARRNQAFTLIEVMMASLILVVAFIGMIEAMAVTSTTMDHARRQTLAAQIITHETEQLRLENWSTILNLSTNSNWSSGTAYSVGALVSYQGATYTCITANTNNAPPNASCWAAYMTWSSATSYNRMDLVSYNGTWYRCIADNSAQTPPNASYWTTYSGAIANTGVDSGAIYTVTRAVSDLTTDLREVSVTVSWVVTTSRKDSSGNPLSFTYSRTGVTYYSKYGLSLSYQRT
jgi:Tfp pilus assembly protein PilV